MKFELPRLPYLDNALEPTISEETVRVHYGKHEQGYIDKVNSLIANTKYEKMNMEEIVCHSDGALFNNASQMWSHIFYFFTLSPAGGEPPSGALASAINAKWGSFKAFQEAFVEAGVNLFGSGWVWLVKEAAGELAIVALSNADNPLTHGYTPLLTFDVWEHAYYIDYRNRRAEHLNEMWQLIDWQKVAERY